MKRFASFFFAAIVVINVNAQIGTTSVATPQQKEQKPAFDSTQNFLGKINVQSYVGQILFVLPTTSKYGYRDFKPIDYNPKMDHKFKHYGRDSEKTEYNTRNEDLEGKYFRIDSISNYNKFYDWEFIVEKYLFYLTNTSDETDRCCFIYDANYEHTFPFMVLSHFNYLKGKYVGREYLIRHPCIHQFDIITGDSIKIDDDLTTTWTVTDLTILDNKYRTFAYVIKSGDMTSYIDAVDFERYYYANGGLFIFDKKEWDSMVKKYGLTMMKMVWDMDIKVGMPERLLLYSWGRPERINSFSDGRKQYVYDNDYVYVKDGKVISWQSY